jgi:hypothetical protein
MIEIIPFKSAGGIKLNDSIKNYQPEAVGAPHDITKITACEFFNGTLTAYVQDDIIEWIAVYGECYLRGINIFNMNIRTFFEQFEIQTRYRKADDRVWVNDREQQDVYEIGNMGLQIWVNDAGRIVSVICDIE